MGVQARWPAACLSRKPLCLPEEEAPGPPPHPAFVHWQKATPRQPPTPQQQTRSSPGKPAAGHGQGNNSRSLTGKTNARGSGAPPRGGTRAAEHGRRFAAHSASGLAATWYHSINSGIPEIRYPLTESVQCRCKPRLHSSIPSLDTVHSQGSVCAPGDFRSWWMVRPQDWTWHHITCNHQAMTPSTDRSARKSTKRRGEERKHGECGERGTWNLVNKDQGRPMFEHPGRGTTHDGETTTELDASLVFGNNNRAACSVVPACAQVCSIRCSDDDDDGIIDA